MTTPEERAAYRADLLNEIEQDRLDLPQNENHKFRFLNVQLAILDEYEALIKATTVKKRLNRMLEITED